MRKKCVAALIWLTAVVLLAACAATPQVERVAVEETIDLSGRWNDTDSQLVADEMIQDCLRQPWRQRYQSSAGSQMPAVIVGQIRNRTHEHINVQTFVKSLERALINSGEVIFVASRDERGQLRDERIDMAENASDATLKGPGEEYGADFMLIGTINSIRDQIKGQAVMYYQTNLELVSLTDNVKVWIGEKKIKKFIKRPQTTW